MSNQRQTNKLRINNVHTNGKHGNVVIMPTNIGAAPVRVYSELTSDGDGKDVQT